MTTLGDLVTRTQFQLRSYTGQHERSTYLTASISASDVNIAVADGAVVSSGLVEVDDELLWVDSVNSGALVVPPYGRGYLTTTAVAHGANTQVLVDPFFPRVSIAQAIKDTQLAVYPELYRTSTYEFTFNPAVSTYQMPADCDRILGISFQRTGPSGEWPQVKQFRLDTNADPDTYTSGKALTLLQGAQSGRTVRVVYTSAFTEFTDAGQSITDMGHSETQRDLLVYGACYRVVQGLEASRLNLNSVENEERAKFFASGAASALTRQLLGLYQQRLEQERDRLRYLNPPSVRFS